MKKAELKLFALHPSQELGEQVAAILGLPLDAHEERNFEDGEQKIRSLVSVRDHDVYVLHSLFVDQQQTVHDKLCKLLFFIASLKDAGAQRVTALLPYLCYARKDRRTKTRDPVTLRYVAQLLESIGVDRVVAVDVHNLQAYQNAFRCKTEHLEARQLFVSYFKALLQLHEKVLVMSPDIGGVKRAEHFRQSLSRALARPVDFAFMEKQRSEGQVSGERVVGKVEGRAVIILDDLISSGTTMARAAAACHQQGATGVYAVATHGAFAAAASEAFQEKAIKKIVVTNTIWEDRLRPDAVKEKLVMLDITPLLAETIHRLHTGGSLVSLFDLS